MHKRERSEDPEDRFQETDVFITEYVNKTTCFTAIIKQRFSDFQVFEIDEKGNEIHLTSLENDVIESRQEVEETADFLEENIDINEIPVKELNFPLCLNDQWKQLMLLMKRNKKEESIKMEVSDLNKAERTDVHNAISKKFKGALTTKTVEEADNKKFIIIGTRKSVDKRNLSAWPKNFSQYLHFVLYKENIDTINAVRTMCKCLRISQNSISYAGTKDRRGVTTQRMCIRRITAKRVNALNRNRLWCGNFQYKDDPLKLGQLKGNRFLIALRNVESTNEIIDETMKCLKKQGFVNYYGLQRFGAHSAAPTFEIGKNLICNEWDKAISLILKPCRNEKQIDIRRACEMWTETRDAVAAAKYLKYYHTVEGTILKTLSLQGNNAHVNALQKVPRNILLLYIHSFQSIVWNRIISRRLKEYGLKVLPGDLIYVNEVNDAIDCTDELVYEDTSSSKIVRPISTTEIENVNIYDVVYPLPGYSVKYPENEIANWYREILDEYGVVNFSGKNKMFTLSGDYRKMLILPQNVEWKTVFYNNPSADLIATDLQKLKSENTIENLKSGFYKAVILEFNLPACTYATMALREITKTDTSSSHQALLTSGHLQNKRVKVSE